MMIRSGLQLAGLRIQDSTASVENVLQSLPQGGDSSKVENVFSALGWGMLCTFVLAGVILIGAVIILHGSAIIAKPS
jgi:hypothetical protein